MWFFKVCSAYIAEFWEVFEGCTLLRECGFQRIELHVDSQIVISSLKTGKKRGCGMLEFVAKNC